ADIDFALHVGGGSLTVFESGVARGTFPISPSGDRLRVGVEAGLVVYRRNGTAFYTSSVLPNYPLLVDTSFWDVGGQLVDIVLSGTLQDVAAATPTFNVPPGD